MGREASAIASQIAFPTLCPLTAAVEALANADGTEERGAVFTRREVVDFILDLAGFTSDVPIFRNRVLEPSFGDGDFLLPIVERLVASWKAYGDHDAVSDLSGSLRAVEIHRSTYQATRAKVVKYLQSQRIAEQDARHLTNTWLTNGDFLLTTLEGEFDFVLGNPPYVRQELIPDELLIEYRARYRTLYDRADLYIPFIERSLSVLTYQGRLGFICANRWMKNRYGGPLRKMIAHRFHLKIYVDMVDTPAFHSDVIAYPAITIISRESPGLTRVAHQPDVVASTLATLSAQLLAPQLTANSGVTELEHVAKGEEPWILHSDSQLPLVRRLEKTLPTLEEAGCKVGIGVATGADKAFIGRFDELDVENDRKLPLAMTRDIDSGVIKWRGFAVINPFADDGGLVRLDDYPKLRSYLEVHKAQIAGRHVAQKMPANWYRTIDRIYPALANKPKLLIPDIKGAAHIVFEEGRLYPHHNLYYITSEAWDLEALQGVLQSGIARIFISAYSTRMRGGYLRFQAQYLRRIRVPHWEDVSEDLRYELTQATRANDAVARGRAVAELYRLTSAEASALSGDVQCHST